MKRKLLWAVKLLCLTLALAVGLWFIQENYFCHADHNRVRVKGFFLEDADSLDVVYLGASEVYSDIAPGYAYERDGITGYLFATQANTILNYKNQLKNILSRQKDALIVIELNGALYDDDELTKEANLRNYSDNAPLDFDKIEYVAKNVGENHLEYLFPFIKYHGTWSDAEYAKGTEAMYRKTIRENNSRGYSYLKGVLNWPFTFQSPTSLNSTLAASADKKQPLNETAEKSLRELLAYCRDEGLSNVVFARFPHIVTEKTYDRFERNNTVADIVKEYGFDYLNFERDFALTGLDEKTDFYNLDHLNVYGQKKFTAFLTDYLKEHYGLSSHALSVEQREEWETCADYYAAYVTYNEKMMKEGNFSELSEDSELIKTLDEYLPQT